MNPFDEFAKECKEKMPFEEGWKKIWTKVFSLDKIILAVQKPVMEKEKTEPYLFIGTMNEAPCVFAFSDEEHFNDFQKHVIDQGDKREVAPFELTIENFLNFTQNMASQQVPFLIMNFGSEYSFHTMMQEVLPMYNAFIKGDYLQEHRIQEGTMITVTVPDRIEEIKQVIQLVKGKYKNVINSVSPLLVRMGTSINSTLVIHFKGGLPLTIKKKVMQNLLQDLSVSPLFQIPIHFTEEESIIPPELKDIVQVKF